MGKLLCLKCAQTAEGDTFEEADSLIDHAATSTKCSGSPSYLRWDDVAISTTTTTTATTKKKKK